MVTGVGVTLFSLAGSPPTFGDTARYSAFVRGASTLLLTDAYMSGLSAVTLAIFIVGTAVAIRQTSGASLRAALVLGLGVISSTLLAVVGVLEMTTVYVAGSDGVAASTGPVFLIMQGVLLFLYFIGAALFATLALSVSAGGLLPGWLRPVLWTAASLQAVATLAVFGGTGDYGPLGIIQVMVGFVPSAIAVLLVSVALVRSRALDPQPTV